MPGERAAAIIITYNAACTETGLALIRITWEAHAKHYYEGN